ncbi:MAG TPA: TetR/AcrR family transcriptional regulator [Solirubrobacteraceae bacterium]|nr:TetR/AcrR family transcriptional regulator [Solirubrobacteraceae bacterium]
MSVASSARRERSAKAPSSRSAARARLEDVKDRQGAHVAVVQRARLLAGAVRAVDKYGYVHTTVSEITALAHVSRRTFYELFAGSEECLLATYEEILGRAQAQLAAAELDGLAWLERVRGGLWAILCFLDTEPVLARVGIVQSARGGPQIVELRERLFAQLTGVIDEGRSAGSRSAGSRSAGSGSAGGRSAGGRGTGGRGVDDRAADCPELIAEGLVGAVLSILHTRLVRGDRQPLKSLQGELMAMIVAPYLGPAAARAERRRAAPPPISAPASSEASNSTVSNGSVVGAERDPLHGVSMRFTYRTACVLEALSLQPGMSNRGVGKAAGIPDQGQVSKLLARLQGLRLVENTAPYRKGAANAWKLTPGGEQVVRVVGMGAAVGAQQ